MTTDTSTTTNSEAVRFCDDILTNTELRNSYYTSLSTAAKDPDYEIEIVDNFLTKNGYTCTLEEVLAAQSQIGQYQLYYWIGVYSTTMSQVDSSTSTSKDGPTISIAVSATDGSYQIGVDESYIIDAQFSQLALTWDASSGLNSTAGNLGFSTVSDSQGNTYNAFTGTYTDSDQIQYKIAGTPAATTSDSSSTTTPTGTDLENLQLAGSILNIVAQSLFIGMNLYMMYKLNLEIKSLKAGSSDAEAAQSQAEETSAKLDKALDKGDEMQEEFEESGDSEAADNMFGGIVDMRGVTGNNAPDLSGDEDLPEMDSDDEELLRTEIKRTAAEESESEDEDSGNEADDEDAGEELENVGSEFSEDAML
ncbi:MAG: hypothetical protein K0V04_16365 [Deltaproteobacteria bacterium]|nr:hypothetical protein [Deltaproteobacteria bacterium]